MPLVRTEKADSVKAALNSVSAKLDTAALADMVKQVVVDKKDASEVAKSGSPAPGSPDLTDPRTTVCCEGPRAAGAFVIRPGHAQSGAGRECQRDENGSHSCRETR